MTLATTSGLRDLLSVCLQHLPSGRVATLDIGASGASDLSLLDLEVGELIVSLSGASSAEVSVNDSIRARLSGASSLRYRGDPDVTTLDVSGASTSARSQTLADRAASSTSILHAHRRPNF